MQPHIRNKPRREALAKRFKDDRDPLKIVIVRDMWLTGFDVPCLHTMYVDKPMRGHGLMQAIARVNRVYKDKPGGLIVDYLGLADVLRRGAGGLHRQRRPGRNGHRRRKRPSPSCWRSTRSAAACSTASTGQSWTTGTPAQCLALLPAAQEHILAQENGKNRLLQAVTELSAAFALAVTHPQAARIRDDVAFFQAVRSVLAKSTLRRRTARRTTWITPSSSSCRRPSRRTG